MYRNVTRTRFPKGDEMPSILPPDPSIIHVWAIRVVVGTVTSNERECIDQPVGNAGENYVRRGMQRIKGPYE